MIHHISKTILRIVYLENYGNPLPWETTHYRRGTKIDIRIAYCSRLTGIGGSDMETRLKAPSALYSLLTSFACMFEECLKAGIAG